MALTVRYFSTSSAGAADGTTWADRATLLSGGTSGTYTSTLTGFDFTANGMEARVGPGTYTATAALAAASFTNAPSIANPLIFHGCDSSGNLVAVPDLSWTSDRAAYSDATFPILKTTTNVATSSCPQVHWRCMRSEATGRNGVMFSGDNNSSFDWCTVVNSTANTAAAIFGSASRKVSNCVLSMTGTSYAQAAQMGTNGSYWNTKLIGVTGSSGNRNGIDYSGTTIYTEFNKLCITGFGGSGIFSSSTNAGQTFSVRGCVIANNGVDGITYASTASQTATMFIGNCCITGNGAYGINTQTAAARLILQNSRLRDNTSGNYDSVGNYSPDDVYTTDSDDATEYVASGSNDFQIKSTVAWANRNIGVSQQASSAALLGRGILNGSRM